MISALKGEVKKPPAKSSKYVVKDPLIKKLKAGIVTDEEEPEVHTPDQSWGFHLLIDARDMDKSIDDEKDIENFFGELIKALDMKPLTEFFCKRVDNKEEGRGISAFQMITTSHISMHFDDAGYNGFMDVFSCKKFDPRIVLKMIKEHFKPKRMMVQFVYRDTGMVIGDGDESDYEMHNTL
jgi:S-adenosylmethionine/arginine decarboxylase-like enzyme